MPRSITQITSLAGYRSVSSLVDLASYGYYWSRTLFENGPRYAWYMGFGSGGIGTDDYYRCFGYSVRPVRAQ